MVLASVGLDAGGEIHQLLAHAVVLAPALQRGDAIFRRDRRAVMPLQAVAQGEGVGELVVADFPVRHLRLDLEIGIGRQQRVVDHVAMIARDVGGGETGIDDAQIGMHHRGDGLAGRESPATSTPPKAQAPTARYPTLSWDVSNAMMWNIRSLLT